MSISARKPALEWVEALKREREGYLRYGRAERAAEVDAVLERLGVTAEKPAPRPRSRAKKTEG